MRIGIFLPIDSSYLSTPLDPYLIFGAFLLTRLLGLKPNKPGGSYFSPPQ